MISDSAMRDLFLVFLGYFNGLFWFIRNWIYSIQSDGNRVVLLILSPISFIITNYIMSNN